MKKPVVDYREFRLSRLSEPQFSHLKLLWGWAAYFLCFFLTERLIPAQMCHRVYCLLDDQIPFCELFLIPYVFWYALIVFSLCYFALYHIPGFTALSRYIIITQVLGIAAYVLFPTRQDLRPETFPRDNFLTRCIGVLYSLDTNTGVCPSMHVAWSIAMASVWLRIPRTTWTCKLGIMLSAVLICLSTMFIKQHSAVDVLAALPVCALAEWMVFRKKKQP